MQAHKNITIDDEIDFRFGDILEMGFFGEEFIEGACDIRLNPEQNKLGNSKNEDEGCFLYRNVLAVIYDEAFLSKMVCALTKIINYHSSVMCDRFRSDS